MALIFTRIAPGNRAVDVRHRFAVLYLLLFTTSTILLGRGFHLQVLRGSAWWEAAEGNRVEAQPLTAPRGIVYDRNNHQLVENVASTDVVIDPRTLQGPQDDPALIDRLSTLLPVAAPDIQDALSLARQTQRSTRLAAALDHDTILRLEQSLGELPGIKLVASLVRRYPLAAAGAHVIGYASPVTAAELQAEENIQPTDSTGKTGLEKQYDTVLRGAHGVVLVEVDAAGRAQKHVDRQEPTAGTDVYLTLDARLQAYIADRLEARLNIEPGDRPVPRAAAVVALDPRSGAVRALVSAPAYDPNVFSLPSRAAEAEAIVTDQRQPLFNRATDGMYPPGSTIKPLLAVAGLAEGLITPETTVLSAGGLNVGPWRFPDWKAGGHGQTDVYKAIAESVNTFFYVLTGGDGASEGLGVERAARYLRMFGWGKPTGIDLPHEAAGFLPTPAWKQAAKHEPWYIGDTYHLAIGQGDVLDTPLQLAAATAAIANGGTLYKPFLVRALSPPNEELREVPTTGEAVNIPSPHITVVQQAMARAVTEGSGAALASLPLAVAGKTGTAQIGGTDETHAWFTSFGPLPEADLVVVILLEAGGEGDKDAVPLAREIWDWWLENRLSGEYDKV